MAWVSDIVWLVWRHCTFYMHIQVCVYVLCIVLDQWSYTKILPVKLSALIVSKGESLWSMVLCCTSSTIIHCVSRQILDHILPSVLCCCWMGVWKNMWPVRNCVMGCWHGYVSGARVRLFAYGPADDPASQKPVVSCCVKIQSGFTVLAQVYPVCSGNEAVKER